MPYRSKAQQRWAHATKQPWAREWDQATKKLKRGKKRGFAALPDRARTKVGKSLYGAIAKKAEPVNRDRQGAAIAGAGASAAGLGAIGGGVPGLNMDYSKHPALKAPMGIFGWRQKAHEGAVRDFEANLARKPSRDGRQRRAEYRKGRPRTRESRAYLRAYTKAKIPEEQKIIRHMRTGRMATNALLVGGLAATGYGIHRAKVQKSDRARDRTFGAVLGAGAGGAAIAEGVSQVLVHQGRKWENKGAEARRAAQRVAPKVTPAHSAYAAWDDPKLLRSVSATDAAEAGRQRGIASQARYFGGVYRNTARHLRTGRNVGLAAAAVGATGLALRPKGKHKSKVGKSYVGAGAYRSISSLSPRARKVLRRNLVLHRKARRGIAAEPGNPAPRAFLESSVSPMPKSNVQRRIDSWREIRSGDTGSLPPQLQAAHATGRKILTQRRKATKTPNLFTTKDATHSQRANLERAARGMKFKTPTVVHLNAKEGSLPDGVPGANIPVRGDTNVVAMGSRGMTARVAGGNRTSMVRHELAHAQGKPGRHVRLQLRKRPMDSLAREEGRAEGIGSQASPSQHSASEYASAFKGKRLSEYRRIRDKVAGRRMKEHRSDAFTLNAINRGRPGGKNKNDTIAALGGTDAWKSNLRELVAANPAPDPYSTAAMEQRARNLREMRRLRRQRPDFYRNR